MTQYQATNYIKSYSPVLLIQRNRIWGGSDIENFPGDWIAITHQSAPGFVYSTGPGISQFFEYSIKGTCFPTAAKSAPAPAPPLTPSVMYKEVPVEVEQVMYQEVPVLVEVVVTATPTPTAKPPLSSAPQRVLLEFNQFGYKNQLLWISDTNGQRSKQTTTPAIQSGVFLLVGYILHNVFDTNLYVSESDFTLIDKNPFSHHFGKRYKFSMEGTLAAVEGNEERLFNRKVVLPQAILSGFSVFDIYKIGGARRDMQLQLQFRDEPPVGFTGDSSK